MHSEKSVSEGFQTYALFWLLQTFLRFSSKIRQHSSQRVSASRVGDFVTISNDGGDASFVFKDMLRIIEVNTTTLA